MCYYFDLYVCVVASGSGFGWIVLVNCLIYLVWGVDFGVRFGEISGVRFGWFGWVLMVSHFRGDLVSG